MATAFTSSRNAGASVTMDTTGLVNFAASNTAVGWQSQKVDDTSTLALDYEINVTLAMSATAPGADKALYVYVVPWYYDGSAWYGASAGTSGTGTLSDSTTGGAATINGAGNNLGNPLVLGYNVTSEVVSRSFYASSFFGNTMPDGWQLVLINMSSAHPIASTSTKLAYKPVKFDSIST